MEMSSRSDWADFPPEVLRLVAWKLANIRFRAVCVSWRLAAGPNDLGQQHPWLVVPTLKEGSSSFYQDGITTVSFFNLPGCRRCFFPLEIPEAQGKWIYASAHGWLLMIGSRSPQSTSPVSLLNPITGATVPLPLLPTNGKDSNIKKALLCAHPASSAPHQLLAAIWITYNTFAFYRQGDTDWTILHSASDDIMYLDIVYFQDELYFIDPHGNLSLLQLESNTITRLIHPRQPEDKPFLSLCLVEAAGDLLLVARYLFIFKLTVFKLHKSANGELSWVVIGDMTPDYADLDGYCGGRCDLGFFTSWIGSVCAQTLPGGNGYQIFFAEASEISSIMTVSILEIHAVVGVGVNKIEQSLCKAREKVGRQRHFLSICVTWMLPNLY